MSRIADVLERESRAVDLEPGDFERLLRRRERKQRNRRIRAGAVGVVVALATAAVLLRSMASEHVPADRVTPPKPVGAVEVLTGGSDLVTRDPDTGELRTIVRAGSLPRRDRHESITSAEWSSDRKWVAFRRGDGSIGGSLWIADSTGGALRRLAPVSGYSRWAWSPTGDQLVLAHGRDVTLFDAATGGQIDLGTAIGTKYWGEVVHVLAWSPDGSRIVYDGGPGSGSVYSIDVESGEHSLLVGDPARAGDILSIDWSPDGAHLAITYYSRTWRRQALYLADADGSRRRLVADGPEVGEAWSPDGTRLTYTTISGPDRRLAWQAWTVSADGSAPSLVASQCCVSGGVGAVWSPDGSQIAFETESGAGTPAVRLDHLVVNADGTGNPTWIDELTYRSWAGGGYFCNCYG